MTHNQLSKRTSHLNPYTLKDNYSGLILTTSQKNVRCKENTGICRPCLDLYEHHKDPQVVKWEAV